MLKIDKINVKDGLFIANISDSSGRYCNIRGEKFLIERYDLSEGVFKKEMEDIIKTNDISNSDSRKIVVRRKIREFGGIFKFTLFDCNGNVLGEPKESYVGKKILINISVKDCTIGESNGTEGILYTIKSSENIGSKILSYTRYGSDNSEDLFRFTLGEEIFADSPVDVFIASTSGVFFDCKTGNKLLDDNIEIKTL